MSDQHPMILFVGHHEQGAQLLEAVEPLGWWVYQPDNANEALGMYVSYLPDVILMNAEAAPDVAEEVYFHLASVAAEPIIVISDDEVWSDRVTHHLEADVHMAEIIASVGEATGALHLIH
jgi:hypothetical protein